MQIDIERSAWPLAVMFAGCSAVAAGTVWMLLQSFPQNSLYTAFAAAIGAAVASVVITAALSWAVKEKPGSTSPLAYGMVLDRFQGLAVLLAIGGVIAADGLMPAVLMAAATLAGRFCLADRRRGKHRHAQAGSLD